MHPFDAHERALTTCFACPKLCRFACPVAEAEGRETSTPWGLMTRAEHVRRGQVPLDRETAEALLHCTGCGRCTTFCRHGVDVAATIFDARAEAERAGLLPPELRAWAEAVPPETAALRALPEGGDVTILPGFADAESLTAATRLLAAVGLERVARPRRGVLTSGARFRAAGLPDRVAVERTRALKALEGARLVVCLEPADALALADADGLEVRSLPEVLGARRGSLLPRLRSALGEPVLYLDDFALGRGLGQFDAPRTLLAAVVGHIEEATLSRREGGCLGHEGGYAATLPAAGARLAREAVADVPGVPVVVASPEGAAHLRRAVPERPVYDWAVLLASGL